MEYTKLYSLSKEWVSKRMKSFTSIDLKNYFLTSYGYSVPSYVLGRVFQNLVNDSLIRHTDFVSVKDYRNKAKHIKVWVSREYSLKQQKNAKSDKDSLTLDFE
jgi:hypothetical protein